MTPARRPGPVLVVGALVVVAVLMAALAGPWHPAHRAMPDLTPSLLPGPTQAQPPAPSASATDALPPMSLQQERWIFLVILTLVGLVVVVILALVVRRLAQAMGERRVGTERDAADPDIELDGDVVDSATPALREGVRHAAQVLEEEVPPGDAVIAAWVALEASAERSGIVRDRAQTATEFTLEVLDATSADPQATRALLELYLAARYSEHRLTAQDVATARASLAAIAEDLAPKEES